jgi:DNA-binding FrmR family transcriptional regulator
MKKNPSVSKKKITPEHAHPSHEGELPRLRRIKGQVEGLERMILDGRYCVDILTQIKAAGSALKALEQSILKGHLQSCVRGALTAKDSFDAEKKIQEITELLAK